MRTSYWLLILLGIYINNRSFSADTQWRYGENVCFGPWEYTDYGHCQDPSHGEITNYRQDLSCGVAGYEQKTIDLTHRIWRGAAPITIKQGSRRLDSPPSPEEIDAICQNTPFSLPGNHRIARIESHLTYQNYKESCAVRNIWNKCVRWNTRSKWDCIARPEQIVTEVYGSTEVDDLTKPIYHSCDVPSGSYLTRRSRACQSESKISKQKQSKSELVDGVRGNFVCSTGDDLPVTNDQEAMVKYTFLRSNIPEGRGHPEPFKTAVVEESIRSIKSLLTDFSQFLTSDQQIDIFTVSAEYPDISYDSFFTVVKAGITGSANCILLSNGKVKCWGYGFSGQFGTGTTTISGLPLEVKEISNAIDLATGYFHACVITADNQIKCWGGGHNGQLGNGMTTNQLRPVTVSLSNEDIPVGLSLGAIHSCTLLANETVKCWGASSAGQSGVDQAQVMVPTTVAGLNSVTQISTGSYHNCALLKDQTVKCWGSGYMLGDGSTAKSSVPKTVSGLTGATQVAAGNGHTCAIKSDGAVSCWGYGSYGQLGDGLSETALTPVSVIDLNNATGISTSHHSCATLADGSTKCWGANTSGQLGFDNKVNSPTPQKVTIVEGISEIFTGPPKSCALLDDLSFKCWGSGHLGDGGYTFPYSQTAVDVIY